MRSGSMPIRSTSVSFTWPLIAMIVRARFSDEP